MPTNCPCAEDSFTERNCERFVRPQYVNGSLLNAIRQHSLPTNQKSVVVELRIGLFAALVSSIKRRFFLSFFFHMEFFFVVLNSNIGIDYIFNMDHKWGIDIYKSTTH